MQSVESILATAQRAGVSITPRFYSAPAAPWATLAVKGRLTSNLRDLLAGVKWAIIASYLEPQLTQVSDALFRLERQGKADGRTYENLTGHFTNLRCAYELCHIAMQRQQAAA